MNKALENIISNFNKNSQDSPFQSLYDTLSNFFIQLITNFVKDGDLRNFLIKTLRKYAEKQLEQYREELVTTGWNKICVNEEIEVTEQKIQLLKEKIFTGKNTDKNIQNYLEQKRLKNKAFFSENELKFGEKFEGTDETKEKLSFNSDLESLEELLEFSKKHKNKGKLVKDITKYKTQYEQRSKNQNIVVTIYHKSSQRFLSFEFQSLLQFEVFSKSVSDYKEFKNKYWDFYDFLENPNQNIEKLKEEDNNYLFNPYREIIKKNGTSHTTPNKVKTFNKLLKADKKLLGIDDEIYITEDYIKHLASSQEKGVYNKQRLDSSPETISSSSEDKSLSSKEEEINPLSFTDSRNKEAYIVCIPSSIQDEIENAGFDKLNGRLEKAIWKGFTNGRRGSEGIKKLTAKDEYKLYEVKILGNHQNGETNLGNMRLLCISKKDDTKFYAVKLTDHDGVVEYCEKEDLESEYNKFKTEYDEQQKNTALENKELQSMSFLDYTAKRKLSFEEEETKSNTSF